VLARKQVHNYTSSLAVDEIYKGACDTDFVLVDPGPMKADTNGPGTPAIYFLAENDGHAYSEVEPPVPASSERDVIASLASVTAGDPAPERSNDLATFRSMANAPWTPAQRDAIVAARGIFAVVSFIGMTPDRVEKALGAPARKGTTWSYARHDGEAGVMRDLRFENGRVVSVRINRTQ
jgi:hypothetical protein